MLSVMAAIMMSLTLAVMVGAAAEGREKQTTSEADPAVKLRVYGAQWVSPSLQDSFFATGTDLSSSIERAAKKCERAASDCAPGVWVKNGYASFAVDVSGAWGTGWGKYQAEADREAMAACEFSGGLACEIEDSRRTGSYNPVSLTEGGFVPSQSGTGGSGFGTRSAPAPVTVSPPATTVVTPAPTTTTTSTPPPL